MKSHILLIGGVGAGKTTLKQYLMNEAQAYRKTQMLEFKGFFIDCPGEYLQMPTYYRVLILTDSSSLEAGGKSLPIIPGMVATVEIRTGEKTILDYLLKPVLRAREAFRER